MDLPQTLRDDRDFRPAVGAVERGELAIRVGHTDLIGVDQGEAAHAAAGEGFGRPRSDTARADHRDVGTVETFERPGSVEPGQTRESIEIVRGGFFVQAGTLRWSRDRCKLAR